MAASCLVVGAAMGLAALQHTTVGYAVAAFLIVPGEILNSIAAGSYISKHAPTGATGRYQAVLTGSLALASLPSLGLALALELGGRPLIAALPLGSAAGAALACRPLARALHARSVQAAAAS